MISRQMDVEGTDASLRFVIMDTEDIEGLPDNPIIEKAKVVIGGPFSVLQMAIRENQQDDWITVGYLFYDNSRLARSLALALADKPAEEGTAYYEEATFWLNEPDTAIVRAGRKCFAEMVRRDSAQPLMFQPTPS